MSISLETKIIAAERKPVENKASGSPQEEMNNSKTSSQTLLPGKEVALMNHEKGDSTDKALEAVQQGIFKTEAEFEAYRNKMDEKRPRDVSTSIKKGEGSRGSLYDTRRRTSYDLSAELGVKGPSPKSTHHEKWDDISEVSSLEEDSFSDDDEENQSKKVEEKPKQK